MKRARIDWLFVLATAMGFAFGCGGGGCGGCGGMEPIPGGFPSAKRVANGAQLRITQSALAKIVADPAAVLGPLVGGGGNGVVTFALPTSCGGTPICCPNGTPIQNCGPIDIDLVARPGDPARLALTPASVTAPNGRLEVAVHARVKTVNDLVVTFSGANCKIKLDTAAGGTNPDLQITTQIGLVQDGTTGTTRVEATGTQVTLEQPDVTITNYSGSLVDLGCLLANFLPISFIQDQLAAPIQNAINDATCKSCGTVADCSSPFATECKGGTCMAGTKCLQEIGLNGRMRGSTLLSSLSPGTTGALDLYEVAGGYSTTNNGGISLGLRAGMLPGGAERDRCGPPGTAPGAVPVAQSDYFRLNTRPDDGSVYDVGLGIHKSQLAQLAYSGYDGGLFCLTIGSNAFERLSTDTIGLISQSLGKLVEGNSPMAVGIRPQSAPAIALGKNTFKDDGNGNMVVDQPLLDLTFDAVELDFFASIDEQYVRVFTVVADVHLPVGLQTTAMGELAPVIGNPTDAFTNISVKNSEAVTESPDDLAGVFPTLLALVLPQLSNGLSPISLPKLGGLAFSVSAVTAVDNDNFLAIYGNLVSAPQRPVETTAEIVGVSEPGAEIARDVRQWNVRRPPAVTLALGGSAPGLEFSYRTDHGSWSAWSASPRQTVTSRAFWLPGVHKLEVRARQIGHPETIDVEPVALDVPLGTHGLAARSDFHGQSGGAGCNCDTSSGGSGGLIALVLCIMMVPVRRLRLPRLPRLRRPRRAARTSLLIWLVALACLPGCSCGGPCGDVECLPGDLERGAVGRWTSIASDDARVLVATYDQGLGDLVVIDATDRDHLVYRAVDGIPDVTPTHDPDSYRNGVEDPGPDVGAWTSIAMSDGLGRVAYQDRDEHALKFAYETQPQKWSTYLVDGGDADLGVYSSLVFDADHKPAVAYLAIGLDDPTGHRMTELRLARGKTTAPTSTSEWTSAVIASAPGTCAGLCGSEQCVTAIKTTDPQECVVPTSDCTPTCSTGRVCVAGKCREKIVAPDIATLPDGTGLYVSLVVLPDGKLAAAYYDRTRRALVLAVESTKGMSDFVETVLDGNALGVDRGMWSSAVVGGDGTVHVAYQDALGDQLMYTTWNGSAGKPELVDNGQRPGSRTHPVGAAATIYLVGGSPAIAYQDGLVADVMLATRTGTTWMVNPVATGPLLDGFSIGVTTGHGSPILAWGSLDPAQAPPNSLVVVSQ